jgi:hypothetical protein
MEVFKESQRFNQWWIWTLQIMIVATFAAALIVKVFYDLDFGNNPMATQGLVVGLSLSVVFLLFFRSIKLETSIDEHGLHVRFFPFKRKRFSITPAMISSWEVRQYSPMSEFGGWGFRGIKSDRALTISGKTGLQIKFTDGRKLLIGTRKATEIEKAMEAQFGIPAAKV